jgi:CheY-like chemotaxis protein
VLDAANGPDALNLAQEHRGTIDLLLTDLVMPGMSGREVAQRFRQMCPLAPVLFTSGYHQESSRAFLSEQEEIVLFRKPFSGSALTRKVRELLDAHAAKIMGRKR